MAESFGKDQQLAIFEKFHCNIIVSFPFIWSFHTKRASVQQKIALFSFFLLVYCYTTLYSIGINLF